MFICIYTFVHVNEICVQCTDTDRRYLQRHLLQDGDKEICSTNYRLPCNNRVTVP